MERQKTTLAAYNELYKEQDDLYRGAARGFGLSDCAFWVLYALRETKRPMTQSGICAAVYQPKQTVHSALKKLEGEGYLRLAEGRDRRSKEESGMEIDNTPGRWWRSGCLLSVGLRF